MILKVNRKEKTLGFFRRRRRSSCTLEREPPPRGGVHGLAELLIMSSRTKLNKNRIASAATAEWFRRFWTAHLFCYPRNDLIQSCRGFHKPDSTRACLTKEYNRRKLFFQITMAQDSLRRRLARPWPALLSRWGSRRRKT